MVVGRCVAEYTERESQRREETKMHRAVKFENLARVRVVWTSRACYTNDNSNKSYFAPALIEFHHLLNSLAIMLPIHVVAESQPLHRNKDKSIG